MPAGEPGPKSGATFYSVSDTGAIERSQAKTQPRLIVPDLARGLALAGIAMANATTAWMINDFHGSHIPGHTMGGMRDGSVIDQIAVVFSAIFVHCRGLPMFTTLLGYGVGLVAASAWRKRYPAPAARKMLVRRYGFLALFGCLHLLFFYGDIMLTYGIIGIVIALLFAASTKTLRIIAYTVLVIGTVLGSFGAFMSYQFGAPVTGFDLPETTGMTSVGIYFTVNGQTSLSMLASAPFNALYLGGLALIGYVWAREGILVNVDRHKRTLWSWVILGAAVALGVGIPWAMAALGQLDPALEEPLSFLNVTLGLFTGPAILAAIALATNGVQKRMYAEADATGQAEPPAWARPFVALGKRSMSGYLAQTVLFILLVMPFTLGLGLEFSVTGKLLTGLGIWAVTLILATVMERAGIPGPFEQVHRRASYGATRRLEPYAIEQSQ